MPRILPAFALSSAVAWHSFCDSSYGLFHASHLTCIYRNKPLAMRFSYRIVSNFPT